MTRHRIPFLVLATFIVLAGTLARAEEAAQYVHGDITVPGASADEPTLEQFSPALALEYLEQGAAAWTGQRKCVTCHTNGTYMVVRPALSAKLGPPSHAMREFFIATLNEFLTENMETLQQSTRPAQVVYVAAGLAEWDARVRQDLSLETRQALSLVFSIQRENGTWGALDCWPPYESDGYHLATVAAMAAATAPGWLESTAASSDEKLKAGVARLKEYLRTETPPHDYSRVLLLWAATRMKDLLDESKKSELVELIAKHQRPDGGWSIRTFAAPMPGGRATGPKSSRPSRTFPIRRATAIRRDWP